MKKKTAKTKKDLKPQKTRTVKAKAAPKPIIAKRPRGRPRRADTPTPPTPPAPPQPQPPAEQKPDLIQLLLLRLVSPLQSLPVQTAEAVVYLRPEEIAYMTISENRRILIYDLDGQEWQRFDFLSSLEDKLKEDPRFFRAHKSFLVNVFAIRSLQKNATSGLYEVTFRGKVKGVASVSAGNLKELRARLEL